MKKIIISLLFVTLLIAVGCAKVDTSEKEKEIAESIINKLQTQDKIDLTEKINM